MMTLKYLKEWVNSLPEEFDSYQVVNGEASMTDDNISYRVDKPVISLDVDEDTKEILLLHQLPEEVNVILGKDVAMGIDAAKEDIDEKKNIYKLEYEDYVLGNNVFEDNIDNLDVSEVEGNITYMIADEFVGNKRNRLLSHISALALNVILNERNIRREEAYEVGHEIRRVCKKLVDGDTKKD